MFGSGGSGGAAAAPSLDGLSGALGRVIDGLLDVDPDCVADAELAHAMLGLRRQQGRLAAVVAEQTAAFEARQGHAADGSRSATDWIAVHGRLPRGQVAGEVRDARRLRSMPATRAAVPGRGPLGRARAGFGPPGRPPPGGAALPRRGGPPGRRGPAGAVRRLAAAVRVHARRRRPRRARTPPPPRQDLCRFRIGVGLDGVGHADGYLTPVAAAAVTGALECIERGCSPPTGPPPRRSTATMSPPPIWPARAAQRRHDALVEMATRALTAPADGKRPAPLVTVMVDFDTFTGRVCELAAGTVIAPGAVAELLGADETLIQRVVADGANRHPRHQLRPQPSAARCAASSTSLHRRCGHEHLLRPRRPLPGRPHRGLDRRRVDQPGQRTPGLRLPQPLVVHHRPIPPTTTRTRHQTPGSTTTNSTTNSTTT